MTPIEESLKKLSQKTIKKGINFRLKKLTKKTGSKKKGGIYIKLTFCMYDLKNWKKKSETICFLPRANKFCCAGNSY